MYCILLLLLMSRYYAGSKIRLQHFIRLRSNDVFFGRSLLPMFPVSCSSRCCYPVRSCFVMLPCIHSCPVLFLFVLSSLLSRKFTKNTKKRNLRRKKNSQKLAGITWSGFGDSMYRVSVSLHFIPL